MSTRVDEQGLLYLLSKLLLLFVRQEAGKGLSKNDLTDDLKQRIMAQFSGSYNDLTNKPDLSSFQTVGQVESAIGTAMADVPGLIASALTSSGFQTAAQVNALIDAALETLDAGIFIVVETLPPAATANPNKIYLAPSPKSNEEDTMEEWVVVDGKWEKFGSVDISLEGYFNESNLVPITNAEIDIMIASLL